MSVRTEFSPGEFCWIDLVAHDLQAAVDWYGKLFDWSHFMMEAHEGSPPYAFFMKGQAAIAGIGEMNAEMKGQGVPPMWNNYINTADCEATEARVRELGGTVTVPTFEIPGKGKLAFFLDPEGACFAAWQTIGDSGQEVVIREPGALSWNELMTRDTAKAKEFYGELVGWEYTPMPMDGVDYVVIKNEGEDAGGLMPMDGPQFEGVPAHWLVYFEVTDCDAMAARAQENGGKVLVPPTTIPVGKFSLLQDPQGAVFSIVSLTKQDC